ncbi:MAG: response regulator transcription factor [Chromatiales bacterium]|nr:response regulator transcription factor [Gammaproteobacteria bacterium]MBW6476719.1 response regulator transcription factor [Chromatiales bacterium]
MHERAVVLIVDDDEAVRDSLSWLMTSVGLTAHSFASADELLAIKLDEYCGCMLLDIRMPGMSGLELQALLHQQGISLPIIMISGHADVPMAVRALKAGAFDFIEKPFNDQALLDIVQRAIETDRHQRDELGRLSEWRERMDSLTPREREVMREVVAGSPNKVIATRLGVSLKTVESHRARVMEKLEAGSVSQLVRMCLELDKDSG